LTPGEELETLVTIVRRQNPFLRAAAGAVALYRERISPRLPRTCAYDETCSEYALRQLTERGLMRGGWAAFRRYRNCTAATAERLSPSSTR